jgi:2,4-dienoyl-CoA reductase-like NADH-dependent reductase (Old Yellow Enzyme family)/thioredoxin reductase
MKPKYDSLLAPLTIRGRVLKNRLEAANSLPHFLMGPETYPADSVISHFANKAKGAAIVTCMGINEFSHGRQLPMRMDMGHFPDYDLYDSRSQNYLLELTDVIHYYGSIASMSLFVGPPSGYPLMIKKNDDVDQGMESGVEHTDEKPFDVPKEDEFEIELIDGHQLPDWYDEERLEKIARSYAEQTDLLKLVDFDMVSIHFAYRANLPAKFLSPLTNHRTDKFGGSLENRMRFPLMVLKAVREALGPRGLLEITFSAEDEPGGYSIDDSVTFLNEAKKYIDIVQLRAADVDPAHPTGFTLAETPFLDKAAYIKERVNGLVIATIGGYQDPAIADAAVKEGKADIISMARAWISNPDYYKFVKEGRGEDIVPCLRCNKCHGRGKNDPFHSICSVNPIIGLEHRIDRMIAPVEKKKKVAIIGGGPAGLRCAVYIKDRGHDVTIYEASDSLGGAIRHADYIDFKWPLARYKKYLVEQVGKRDITIRLNTAPTPDQIGAEGYDVVVAALGAVPVRPPIRGLTDHADVKTAFDAIIEAGRLGHNVAIIGGGEVGVETGMKLAKEGHEVTVIEMRDELAADTTRIHYLSMFKAAWEAIPAFHGIVNATVTSVSPDGVFYKDKAGTEHKVAADSIVVSVGMKSKTAEAEAFYGAAPEFYIIGDCSSPATVQQATRSAFATAMQI